MNKTVFSIMLLACMYACKSSQKKETQQSNKAFNEAMAGKQEKNMLQTGIDFFAEGNIPSNWNLKIDYDDTVRFSADDGLALKFAFNQLQKNINTDRSIFSTKIKAGDISITVFDKDCTLSSKKEVFKKEVQFSFNGNVYKGCGKFLADNTLNNKWLLEKIGNTPINITEYNRVPIFELDTEKISLAGNDGCNTINGNIEVQGSRIKFGEIISTEMACNKKSIRNIISTLLYKNIASYYFKEGKLYLYLIDDSLLIFKKA